MISALWDDVEKEANKFMVAVYGGLGATMIECRQWLWAQKTAKSYNAPKLCSLPPTTEAFMQNAKRAHFQVVQCVTCRLYTPLHYRIGGGRVRRQHYTWWSTLAVGSLYQAACDRAYHGVIAIGHW